MRLSNALSVAVLFLTSVGVAACERAMAKSESAAPASAPAAVVDDCCPVGSRAPAVAAPAGDECVGGVCEAPSAKGPACVDDLACTETVECADEKDCDACVKEMCPTEEEGKCSSCPAPAQQPD